MSLRIALAALSLLLAATPAAARDLPGFGDSEAEPVGRPWILPEGLELRIVSYNPFDPDSCKTPGADEAAEPQGPEGLVKLCLQFINRTNGRISVELPPGLIFVSESRDTQNGLLIERLTIEVPAGQFMFAPIKADCMNASRSAPGVALDYRTGPETEHPPLVEALRLLADKDLSDPLDAMTASMVLKPLYLGRPLSAEGRATIADLPSR